MSPFLNSQSRKVCPPEVTLCPWHVFQSFVPPEFLEILGVKDLSALEPGLAKQANLSILFADLRQFTAFSETITPQELFSFINAYLKRMESPIRRNHGFIDKFIGDAIMAIFPETAEDAVNAALEMQSALRAYNASRFAKNKGYRTLELGLGIHTGEVMVGVIGSAERMDTTVLGDTVNLTSRLESLTKYYGCPLLITESTYIQVKHMENLLVRWVDKVRVNGKNEITTLYEIYNYDAPDIRQKKQEYYSLFQEAWEAYLTGCWDYGKDLFERYLFFFPEDITARRFAQRCQWLLHQPPRHWTGVYGMENK